MAAFLVVPGEHVEEEGLHVVIEGLVVQEELGQQAEVLAVHLAHGAINLGSGGGGEGEGKRQEKMNKPKRMNQRKRKEKGDKM